GPSIAIYLFGAPLLLLTFSFGVREDGLSLLWVISAGIGLFSCVALARCQRREWLGTVSWYNWVGIAIGYAAFLIPVLSALFKGNSIPWQKLLTYHAFALGGGPALYVPVIATWMIMRERRYRRDQGVVTTPETTKG